MVEEFYIKMVTIHTSGKKTKKPWYSIAIATIDKTSVSDEINRLKQEFELALMDKISEA